MQVYVRVYKQRFLSYSFFYSGGVTVMISALKNKTGCNGYDQDERYKEGKST